MWYSIFLLAPLVVSAPVNSTSSAEQYVSSSPSAHNDQNNSLDWRCPGQLPCFVAPVNCEKNCEAGLSISSLGQSSTEFEAYRYKEVTTIHPVIAVRMLSPESNFSRVFVCVPHERRVYMARQSRTLEVDNTVNVSFVSAETTSTSVSCRFIAPLLPAARSEEVYEVALGDGNGPASLEDGVIVQQKQTVSPQVSVRAMKIIGIRENVEADEEMRSMDDDLESIAEHEDDERLGIQDLVSSASSEKVEDGSGEQVETTTKIVKVRENAEDSVLKNDPKLTQTAVQKKMFEEQEKIKLRTMDDESGEKKSETSLPSSTRGPLPKGETTTSDSSTELSDSDEYEADPDHSATVSIVTSLLIALAAFA